MVKQDRDEAAEMEEMEEFLVRQQELADQWRARLARPEVKAQVRAGTIRVSPLVQHLLEAFPPKESPPR